MIRPAIAFLVSVAAAIGLIYFEGASIARDIPLRNETFVPAQASITEAKCKTHWFVYTRCEVSYKAQQTPSGQTPQQTSSLSYSFLGPAPAERVLLIQPINDRQTIVADVGINHLGNRIALLVVGLCAFGCLGFFSLRQIATA
jgi:hypothetical protein